MQTTTHYGLQKPDPNDTYNKATDNANMDAIDAQMYANAQAIFGSTSVVISGGVATKDLTTATQLDVTSATVYFGTGQNFVFAASINAQFTTATASTTYYLDYNSDDTVSWGTTHSTKTGYVPICSVATDASGNISNVTDARPTVINLFGGATDKVKITGDVDLAQYNKSVGAPDGNGNYPVTTYSRPGGNKFMVSTLSGVMDANGNYPTMTNVFYRMDGTTVDHTDTWTLVYDTNSKVTSTTVVRS